MADSHRSSILSLKLNSDDQFDPYVVPLGVSIEKPLGDSAHPPFMSWYEMYTSGKPKDTLLPLALT